MKQRIKLILERKQKKRDYKFLQANYQKGTRLELRSYAGAIEGLRPRTVGTVLHVSRNLEIFVKWETGRVASLLVGRDSWLRIWGPEL